MTLRLTLRQSLDLGMGMGLALGLTLGLCLGLHESGDELGGCLVAGPGLGWVQQRLAAEAGGHFQHQLLAGAAPAVMGDGP